MRLNKNQEEATKYIEGPLLIIAGPGSGKTKTLVERVAYMIEKKDIAPEQIMITTFTERASNEIFSRITTRLSDTTLNLKNIYIGTIHSICLRIIDENIDYSYLNKGYNILDRVEQKFFLYSKLRLFREKEELSEIFKRTEHLSSWKIGERLLKLFNRISEGEEIDNPLVKKAYQFYRELLAEENSIDFSLIQQECYRILSENRECLSKLQEQVKYIMVDEYQDTNEIQEKLIFLIGEKHKNICVVGDDDQGIYRFRGATIKNILRFKERVGGECKTIRLDINYRSEKNIVEFCQKWIKGLDWGEYRYDKNLIPSDIKNKDTLRVIKLSVPNSEKKWQERLANFLLFLKRNEIIKDYNQVAFLFKSVRNKRIISLGEYLESKGIKIYSPRSNMFFEREEIKKIIACFLYILLRRENSFYSNQNYEINRYYFNSLKVLKNDMEKNLVLSEELKKLKEEYRSKDKLLGTTLNLYYKIISTSYFKEYFDNNQNNILSDRALYNLAIFSKLVKKFDRITKLKSISDKNILGLSEYFFKTHLSYLRKNGVDEYENIREYAPSGAVLFLTIHQAKGLEFPIVIIGSLEATPDETEEKKKSFEPNNKIGSFDFWRLYYTGFSRAENLLILTAIETKTKNREVPSSPFKKLYESLPDASVREIGYQDMKIEEIKPLDIKRRYSFTGDLIRYLHCPFKYNMNYNFRFEKVVTPDNFYGILLHETLEYINKSLMENLILEKEKIEEIYFKNYDLLSKKESIRLKKSVLEEGLRQILNYFNSSLLSEKILEIEKELYISTVDYIVEGRLDMIIEDGEGLKVVDFKTGKRDEKDIEKYRQQIVLYCYLLSENSNKMVSGGEIYFIENGEREFIPYKKGDEIDILKRFEEMNRAIIDKQLNKKNRDIVGCAECEFKNHCFSINMV